MKIIITGNIAAEGMSFTYMDTLKLANQWPNPERQQAMNMNRQYYHLPEYVKAWEETEDGTLILQRDYLDEIKSDCVVDNRVLNPAKFPELNGIVPRSYQKKALIQIDNKEQGILEAPTGAGKTILGLILIIARGQRAVILTHSKALLEQWSDVIRKLIGIESGIIGDGKWQEGELITVAMLQTLSKREEQSLETAQDYGLVLVDECHHIPAKTFSKVISWFPGFYRHGLTATPHRRDGLHQLIHRAVGPTIAKITSEEVEASGGIVPLTVSVISTKFNPYQITDWSGFIAKLINDTDRNKLIAGIAEGAVKTMPVLILTDRIEHVAFIAEQMDSECLQIHGKLPTQERKNRMSVIHEHKVVIGTTGLLGEGLDVSCWQALIMATPISGRVRLLQAIGRVLRPHDGKRRGYVADLVDDCALSVSSYRKRLEIYEERGFELVRRAA